jgi:hypothetical protein
MKPMAAAAVGALIAGVAMYAVGARASQNPFADLPAVVQTVDGQFVRVPGAQPIGYPGYATALQPGYVGLQPVGTAGIQTVANRQVVERQVVERSAPRRTYRTAAQEDRVVVRERADERSWKKSGLIIGGSAASGAGVGAIVGGKKGALIGAALGGGAASIYEATKH